MMGLTQERKREKEDGIKKGKRNKEDERDGWMYGGAAQREKEE